MVIISSLNNTNYRAVSTAGHIIGAGSGLGGVTGLTSNPIGTTTITTINNVVSGNSSYSKEEFDTNFANIKDCLVASDLKMTNMFSKVNCDLDEVNQSLIASDLKTVNMFSKVKCDFEEVNKTLVESDLKMANMFSKLS